MKIKIAKPVIFLFTVMTLTSLACSVDLYGTPTPAPPAVEASSQPEQVEISATMPPTIITAPQFYTEEFKAQNENWEYLIANSAGKQTVSGNDVSTAMRAAGGLLIFDLKNKGILAYATYQPFTYKDVRLDVKAGNRGTNNNKVGLICRKSDAGWYEFDIASNGLYEIFFAKDAGSTVEYTRITDGGSNNIKTGLAENEYGIVCQGNTLVLIVNGAEVSRLNENKHLLPEGKVSVTVSSERSSQVIVDLYSVSISQP